MNEPTPGAMKAAGDAEAHASGFAKGFDTCRKDQNASEESLRAQIKDWENGCAFQRFRADKAEAHVKELEGLAQQQMAKLEELHALRASNAELVAALRGMLAPLEGMDLAGFSPETAVRIRAGRTAIAKAEGRAL